MMLGQAVFVSHTIDWTMFKLINIQNLNKIIQAAEELEHSYLMTPNFRLMLSKASSIKKGWYACQSLDNVKMYKYTKFYQNIPCSSRVISVFAYCSLTGFKLLTP